MDVTVSLSVLSLQLFLLVVALSLLLLAGDVERNPGPGEPCVLVCNKPWASQVTVVLWVMCMCACVCGGGGGGGGGMKV